MLLAALRQKIQANEVLTDNEIKRADKELKRIKNKDSGGSPLLGQEEDDMELLTHFFNEYIHGTPGDEDNEESDEEENESENVEEENGESKRVADERRDERKGKRKRRQVEGNPSILPEPYIPDIHPGDLRGVSFSKRQLVQACRTHGRHVRERRKATAARNPWLLFVNADEGVQEARQALSRAMARAGREYKSNR